MTKRSAPDIAHVTAPINQPLNTLHPLRMIDVHRHSDYAPLYSCLLSRYHYLGYTGSVGENTMYLIVDRAGRPLAYLFFGSPAWSRASRDDFIGWDSATRRQNIHLFTNNTRFLIFPWVRVPHLASHLLATISRRISENWIFRYGHGVCLLETFVDQTHFTARQQADAPPRGLPWGVAINSSGLVPDRR